MTRFTSIDDTLARLGATGYIAERSLATTVYLADTLGMPILAEGPAGVGKTELAKTIATALGLHLERLQCYEGLDEARTLYEWEYPKQLLYTQLLQGKLGETLAGTTSLKDAVARLAQEDSAFFSETFLLARPILRAITSKARVVLLIDEVDRAEAELEAFFLEVLAEFQVTVPELGTIKAKERPLVVLTSNATRELSDALRRRCLHLWLDYPSAARETEIVRARVPAAQASLAAEVVRVVQALRGLELKKPPSIAETIDWTRALVALEASTLDAQLVSDTLNLIVKHQGDAEVARAELPKLLAKP